MSRPDAPTQALAAWSRARDAEAAAPYRSAEEYRTLIQAATRRGDTGMERYYRSCLRKVGGAK